MLKAVRKSDADYDQNNNEFSSSFNREFLDHTNTVKSSVICCADREDH